MTELQKMGAAAKKAAAVLRTAGENKRTALNAAAAALRTRQAEILAANEEDLKAAKENGMSEAMLDRLALTPARIEDMAKGVEDVSAQRDPVGRILSGETNPKGLKVEKITVPMGVIGIIYEARPNVTSDAAALCLMAGSAVILRGGKEAFRSNNAIAEVLRDAIESAGLPCDSVQLVQDTSRASSVELMGMTEYLDLLIPRGGAGLIRARGGKRQGTGHRDRCRQLPRVCRQRRRHRNGGEYHFQRENLPSVRLQRHRNDLGAQGHCRSGAARHLK